MDTQQGLPPPGQRPLTRQQICQAILADLERLRLELLANSGREFPALPVSLSDENYLLRRIEHLHQLIDEFLGTRCINKKDE